MFKCCAMMSSRNMGVVVHINFNRRLKRVIAFILLHFCIGGRPCSVLCIKGSTVWAEITINLHIMDGWRRFASLHYNCARRMTQICVFNTRLVSTHYTVNYAIHGAFLRMVPLTDVYTRVGTVPEILQAVDRSIRTINTTGAAKGILRLPHRWQRVVHNAGDYS